MKTFLPMTILSATAAILLAGTPAPADPARDAILETYASQSGGGGFSASKGEAFFHANHAGGKPEAPACTSCHGTNLKAGGKTTVGKVIDPMAVSINPDRYTDFKKVEKWFRRNCNTVLGRECTAREKGDILTYLSSQ